MQKVLIIDDEPAIAAVLSEVIESNEVEVTIALDGRQGYELAKSGNFELVISDIMMPYLNGQDLCVKLKQNPLTQKTGVFLMSAVSNLAKEEKSALADAFILKPFDIFSVSYMVASFLKSRNNSNLVMSFKPQNNFSLVQ